MKFASSYSFKFSSRRGTPAANSNCQVDDNIKKIRLREIQDLLKKQQIDFNQGTVNKTMDILISDFNKKSQFVDKSPYNQTIIVDTSNAISKRDKIANYNTVNYVGKIKKLKLFKLSRIA